MPTKVRKWKLAHKCMSVWSLCRIPNHLHLKSILHSLSQFGELPDQTDEHPAQSDNLAYSPELCLGRLIVPYDVVASHAGRIVRVGVLLGNLDQRKTRHKHEQEVKSCITPGKNRTQK